MFLLDFIANLFNFSPSHFHFAPKFIPAISSSVFILFISNLLMYAFIRINHHQLFVYTKRFHSASLSLRVSHLLQSYSCRDLGGETEIASHFYLVVLLFVYEHFFSQCTRGKKIARKIRIKGKKEEGRYLDKTTKAFF